MTTTQTHYRVLSNVLGTWDVVDVTTHTLVAVRATEAAARAYPLGR